MFDGELLPCPFCGGHLDYHEESGRSWWSHPSWADMASIDKDQMVRCPTYAWRVYADDPRAIAAWNRRADSALAQAGAAATVASHQTPEVRDNATSISPVSGNAAHAAGTAREARLEAALREAVRIAGEAADEWDKAPEGMRAGKILLALAGTKPGYRADVDAIHAALTPEAPNG